MDEVTKNVIPSEANGRIEESIRLAKLAQDKPVVANPKFEIRNPKLP